MKHCSLELYSFLPKITTQNVGKIPNSAKNCTIPDTCVLPGNVLFFAELYQAVSEGPQKFGKNSAKNCTIPGKTLVFGIVQFFAEMTQYRQLTRQLTTNSAKNCTNPGTKTFFFFVLTLLSCDVSKISRFLRIYYQFGN